MQSELLDRAAARRRVTDLYARRNSICVRGSVIMRMSPKRDSNLRHDAAVVVVGLGGNE
jgi:hypothetical protein